MIRFGGEAQAAFRESSAALQADATPALELLSFGFTITWFKESAPRVWLALLKPDAQISDIFALDLEYLLIGHGFENDFQQRTLLAAAPQEIAYRIDNRVRFVASPAPNLRAACASWAQINKTAIVPIQIARVGSPNRDVLALHELLSRSLWIRDIFDDSEPVADPAEFFGREVAVQELTARSYLGKPLAVFGLRKIGKTSLLRRVKDLLDTDTGALYATAFLQCNATKYRSGRWHAVLLDLLSAWALSITRHAASLGLKTEARHEKLKGLLAPGKPNPTDAAVADAFERDFIKLLKAAKNIAAQSASGTARLVAIFDEADELYPTRADAGYWREDYFSLWSTIQTVKRGLETPADLTFILGGVNPSGVESGAVLGRPNPLFELSSLYLKPLSREEATALLLGLGKRVGLVFEDGACQEAYAITGGHPWLLRKLGSQIHRSQPAGTGRQIITSEAVRRVFARTRRSFYQHIDWILQHLKAVAPDEYRLLRDIAEGGAERFFEDWSNEDFRDTFAEHLAQYGIVTFRDDVPEVSVGLIGDALRAPTPTDFLEQKARLQEAAESLERSIRTRLLTDIPVGRTEDETLRFIVESIPSGSEQRPADRTALLQIGREQGLRAVLDSLNWGDYVLLLVHKDAGISWTGSHVPIADREALLRRAISSLHLARHNNDTALRNDITSRGFGAILKDVDRVLEMLATL
jgi:hypothetical protein